MAQITTNTTKSRVERDIPGGKQIENTKETFTDLVVPWLVIRREFDGASGELIKEYPIDRFDVTTKFYERETETITYLLKSLGIQAGDSMAIPGHGSFSALAELLGLQQGLRIAEPGASILPLGTPQKEASNSGVLIAKEDDREKAKEILENEMPRVFVAETRSELEKALKAVRKAEALGLRVKPLIIVPEKLRKAAASQLAPRQESKLLAEQKTPLALPALIARRVTNYHGALIVGMKEPLRARKLQPVGQELQHAQSLSDLRLPQFDKLQNPLRRAAKISGAIPQRNIAKHGLAMSEAHTQAEKLPQANARGTHLKTALKMPQGLKDKLTQASALPTATPLEERLIQSTRINKWAAQDTLATAQELATPLRHRSQLSREIAASNVKAVIAASKHLPQAVFERDKQSTQAIDRKMGPALQVASLPSKIPLMRKHEQTDRQSHTTYQPTKTQTPKALARPIRSLRTQPVKASETQSQPRMPQPKDLIGLILSKSDLKPLLVEPDHKGDYAKTRRQINHAPSRDTADGIRHGKRSASAQISTAQDSVERGHLTRAQTVPNRIKGNIGDRGTRGNINETRIKVQSDLATFDSELGSFNFGHHARHIVNQERATLTSTSLPATARKEANAKIKTQRNSSKNLTEADLPEREITRNNKNATVLSKRNSEPLALNPSSIADGIQAI